MTLDGNFTVIGGLTAGARPEYIAPGPENTLWFTEKDGNRIGRITGIDLPQQPASRRPTAPGHHRPGCHGLPRSPGKVFRLGGLGTVIRFTLIGGRHGYDPVRAPRRGRWRRVGGRWRSSRPPGAQSSASGAASICKHPLKPGRYRMTLTAKDAAGNVSSPDRTRFRLLPAKR